MRIETVDFAHPQDCIILAEPVVVRPLCVLFL
jgi:hypothetical protein